MPSCARPDLPLAGLLALLCVVGGCSGERAGGQFEIDSLTARWASGHLQVRCEQSLRLSAEARDALQHGVPLTIEVELILRDSASRARVSEATWRYELRYLPLSEHYRVSGAGSGDVATFPRLRHALAQISRLDLRLDTGVLPAGEYEVLARSRLDPTLMPPPMRLPVLFDPEWKHASSWVSWQLTVDPGA